MTTLQDTPQKTLPPLQSGDRLTRNEFEQRYEKMPPGVRAELIEGTVYVMMKPVSEGFHGGQHFDAIVWLGIYKAATPGLIGGDNSSLRMDLANEPQPDAYLRIPSELGGRSRLDADGYVVGAPELIVEIAASSVSYDVGTKLDTYCRNGVQEYVVFRTYDNAVDWFVRHDGKYQPLPIGSDGVYRSEVFPGLWLDATAALNGNLANLIETVRQGIASVEHAAFLKKLSFCAFRLKTSLNSW